MRQLIDSFRSLVAAWDPDPGGAIAAEAPGSDSPPLASIFDFTYVVLSTSPDAEGKHWAFVRAPDEEAAMAAGAALLPAPYRTFKLPTQRVKSLLAAAPNYAQVWGASALAAIVYLTYDFRRSEQGFVVMSWLEAFGSATLLLVTILLIGLSYLAALDFVCTRTGWNALARSSGPMSGGTRTNRGAVGEVLDAFGPDRVAEAVRQVTFAFGCGLLAVTLLGMLLR